MSNPFVCGLTMTILTGLVWGLVGVVFHHLACRNVDYIPLMLSASLFNVLVAWPLNCNFTILYSGEQTRIMPLIITMASASFTSAIGFWIVRNTMKTGHGGIIWALIQSAMIVPAGFAILAFHEQINTYKLIGFLMIISSMVLFASSQHSVTVNTPKSYWFYWALLAFVLLGLSHSFMSLPSHWHAWQDAAGIRLPLLNTCGLLFYTVVYFAGRKKVSKKTFRFGIIYAITVLTGQKLLFTSLDLMNQADVTSLVYPVAIGICVISFTFYSIFIIKEKATSATVLGLTISTSGIVTLVLSG